MTGGPASDPVASKIRDFVRPYLVPVPVKRTSFTSVTTGRRAPGIVTAPGRILAYDGTQASLAGTLLGHADIQIDLYCGHRGRLGSGRALFFGGKYLKGVGRTQLALNWNEVGHASGAFAPTRAMRELLVSDYARANGLAALVACEEVLLRQAPEALGRPRGKNQALDSRWHAISIKPDSFVRTSNLIYLFTTLPYPITNSSFEGVLFLALYTLQQSFVHGGAAWSLGAKKPELEALLDPSVLEPFLERTFGNLVEQLRHGVRLGSTQNNYTFDGRALDLELVTIFGHMDAPHISEERVASRAVSSEAGLDLELFGFRRELRYALQFISRQLAAAVDAYHLPQKFQSALRAYVTALDAAIARSWLGSDEVFLDRLLGAFRAFGALEPAELEFLASAARAAHGLAAPVRNLRLRRLSDVPHDDGSKLFWFYGLIGAQDERSAAARSYEEIETSLQKMASRRTAPRRAQRAVG